MTKTVSPGELHQLFQARLAEAESRGSHPRRAKDGASAGWRGFGSRQLLMAFALAMSAMVAMSVVVAATTVADLTTVDASATINGAIYTQGIAVPVSGTGVLNPFLRVATNTDVERGISTNTDNVLDETNSWTKALLLSAVPVVQQGGGLYREFILDINQTANKPLLSLDEVKIFLTSTPNINSYVDDGLTGGGTINGDSYTAGSSIGHMVFSQGDTVVKLNYNLASGSGKPDMTLLIPDSVFGTPGDASYCAYNQSGCNTWMGFYSQFGGWNGTGISGGTSEWPNNANFEEWATIIRPVVNVSKTVNATASTSCTWGIDKSVDQTEIDIPSGDTATFNYTVSVTHACTTDVAPVTGNIVISNPSVLPDGTKTDDAVVTSVTDSFTPGDVAGAVTCPSAYPFTIKSGKSVTCTYILNLDSATNGTNSATVTLSDDKLPPTIATADVTFDTTVHDGSVNVVDDKTDPAHPVDLGTVTYSDPSPTEFHYSLDKSGVAGTCTDYDNTATFTTSDTATTGSDDQMVTVCVGEDLTVSKTATPAFTRTYTWGIDKSVDQTRIDIADGGTATFNYTVSVTHDSGTDSGWQVTGTITVTNPNDWMPIQADVSDAVDNGGTCSIDGGGSSIVVAASDQVQKDYTCTWASDPTPASGINTATATWDAGTYFTPTGSADGTKDFTFDTPTTLTDESVSVDDTYAGHLGTVTYSDPSPTEFHYSLDKSGVAGTCTDYDNTATFTTSDTATTGSDDQMVTVCVGEDLTVSKTATPAFTRTYTWGIDKSVDQTRIDIADGGTATFNYTVSVTHDSGTDSGWQVTGTITVTNPNDWMPIQADVSDAVDNGGTCTVADDNVGVPAGGETHIDYTCTWASEPSAASGTNTATVSWNKELAHTPNDSATGTADFDFTGAPTTLTDGSVNVVDDKTDPAHPVDLGTVTYSDPSPTEFHYSLDKSGVAGTCTDYDNTATFTTSDTATTGSDDQTVTVCVGEDLTVSKTATPAFTRTYTWGIDKSVDQTRIDIADGGTATFNYTVSVTHDSGTDSGWQVTGTITVTNPNDWMPIQADVSDAVDNGGTCSIDGGGSSIVVAASDQVQKDYTCTWASDPTPASGINTATATWDAGTYFTPTGSADGTKDFTFDTPTTLTDESVSVDDTYAGHLGTVTYSDPSPTEFTYSRTVTPSDYNGCGTFTYDNTATFTTNDTATQGSDSQTVTVNVANCGVFGKTLGFWGNRNGHKILDGNGDGLLDTPVTIGSGGYTFDVTTIAQSDAILSNDDCTGIFTCTGATGLVSGLNPNTFEVLGAQTLALTYNIGNIDGYDGQTIGGLDCQSYLTSPLTGLGLTSSSTVDDVLDVANQLIGDSFQPSGSATQAQEGAMNALLGCLNRES